MIDVKNSKQLFWSVAWGGLELERLHAFQGVCNGLKTMRSGAVQNIAVEFWGKFLWGSKTRFLFRAQACCFGVSCQRVSEAEANPQSSPFGHSAYFDWWSAWRWNWKARQCKWSHCWQDRTMPTTLFEHRSCSVHDSSTCWVVKPNYALGLWPSVCEGTRSCKSLIWTRAARAPLFKGCGGTQLGRIWFKAQWKTKHPVVETMVQ